MSDVLIIGYGVVGQNLTKELEKLKPSVTDKYKNIVAEKRKFKIGFVCVDTPLTEQGSLDVREVKNALQENDCEIYVIKSTVPVGTTDLLRMQGKRVVFSPEFYGGTQHCNNFVFDFTILGGEKADCCEVIQVLQEVYDGRHVFKIVEAKEAEMAKFMENSFLATKVSFCISFFEMCEKEGISYEEVRECFVLDQRVGASHTFVYKEHPYYNSHCLNKDVPAIANQYNDDLLQEVINVNNLRKSKKGIDKGNTL